MSWTRHPVLRASTAVLALALLLAACSGGDDGARADDTPASRPNVVLIVTDDQRLDGMANLPRTTELLGAQGTTFTQAVSPYPLCCPARATMLTGQYSHNHGVLDNVAPYGADALDSSTALPVWLQEAGYTTSHVGKWLNGYGATSPPQHLAGWDRWFTFIDPTTYYSYGMEVLAGDQRLTAPSTPEGYSTDYITGQAVAEIATMAAGEEPFFLQVDYIAPHGMTGPGATLGGSPVPAPRHEDAPVEVDLTDPALVETDLTDKPASVGARGLPGQAAQEAISGEAHTLVAQSLLAVDEGVEQIVQAIDEAGLGEDTLFVFTSDNGLLLGEHAQYGKVIPYEPSLRVPLLVRGAGFPEGAEVDAQVSLVDLAPTIAALAGAEPQLEQDGLSLYPIAEQPDEYDDRAIFLTNGPATETLPHYDGVRVDGWVYAEYDTGEIELYDLESDPSQLESLHVDVAYDEVRAQLSDLVEQLRTCQGSSCDVTASIDRPG